MKIIDRYILRLWFSPFAGGMLLVLSVLMLARALKLLELVSDNQHAWGFIANLLWLTMPYFLLITVPVAFFLAMYHSISALQQSSELDALRAAGLRYRRIFRILFVVMLMIWGGLSYTTMIWQPQSQLDFDTTINKISNLKGSLAFSPQRFTQGFEGMTVYVDGKNKQGNYRGVIIDDHRDNVSVIYVAKTAHFQMAGQFMELDLKDGVRMEGTASGQRTLSFDQYRVTIKVVQGNIRHYSSNDHVTLMHPAALWHQVQRGDSHAIAEWNRRLLLPSIVLILFFYTLPLAMTQKRSGRAGSLAIAIALPLAIYNLQLVLQQKVDQGAFPGWSMWLEHLAALALGVYLWKCAEQDHTPKFITQLQSYISYLRSRSVWKRSKKLTSDA